MNNRNAAIALIVALAFPAVARAQACGCDDLKDLRNRLCEAAAAIQEYGRHIRNIREQEKKTGIPVMYSEQRYKEKVQPCVQEALNQVTDDKARRFSADTNNACNTTFNGSPTACMKDVLTSHENVHVTVCMKSKNEAAEGFFSELRGLFTDFRDGTTLVDLLNEERTAYQTEITHIQGEIDRMAHTVPPCPGMGTGWGTPGPDRIYTIANCPPPRPRPPAEQSQCLFR